MTRPERIAWGVALALLMTNGCVTAWRDGGSFYRSVQTHLSVQSTPPGARIFLNDRYLGDAPITIALDCEQEVKRRTREVSYWTTQPGLSALLSIASLGLYVPFSLIPADRETLYEPTGGFKDNEFSVRLEADGHQGWSTRVACGVQPSVVVHGVLQRM